MNNNAMSGPLAATRERLTRALYELADTLSQVRRTLGKMAVV